MNKKFISTKTNLTWVSILIHLLTLEYDILFNLHSHPIPTYKMHAKRVCLIKEKEHLIKNYITLIPLNSIITYVWSVG